MPMSAAAMDGIAANGHRWRYQIKVAHLSDRLGDEDALKVGDVTVIRDEYVTRVRAFAAATKDLTEYEKDRLEMCCVDLEECDDDLEQVRDALTDLYDCFDFFRICTVR